MRQRIQSPAPSSGSLDVSAVSAPRPALDPVWRWGYIATCLLAIAAAGVIVRGGAASAELGLAALAVDTASVINDICSANGDRRIGPAGQACMNPQENRTLASGVC